VNHETEECLPVATIARCSDITMSSMLIVGEPQDAKGEVALGHSMNKAVVGVWGSNARGGEYKSVVRRA